MGTISGLLHRQARCVDAFVKNSGLGFAIPYLHNGQMHDYVPDFIVRLKTEPASHLILETKGYDPLEEVKAAAAERWVAAVNADGTYGPWAYTSREEGVGYLRMYRAGFFADAEGMILGATRISRD